MIGKSRFGLLRAGLWVVPIVVALSACGEEPEVDPYVYGTLGQVTRGHVISDERLYEIESPEIVFAQDNTAIVRSGNHLEILVGDDIENRASSWGGKFLGVQKFYSPVVWLMAKRVRDGETIAALDSVEAPVLPKFTDVNLEEVSGFDISGLGWNQKEKIEDMLDAEVQTVGTLALLPDHEFEAPDGDDTAQPDMVWYLKAEKNDATFKISNMTPALEIAFRLLEIDDLPFVGGITIKDAYAYADRRASKVSAPIEVNWVRYANRFMAP